MLPRKYQTGEAAGLPPLFCLHWSAFLLSETGRKIRGERGGRGAKGGGSLTLAPQNGNTSAAGRLRERGRGSGTGTGKERGEWNRGRRGRRELAGGGFADDEEGVAGEEAALAVGDDVAVAAANHHYQAPFGERYLAQGVAGGQVVLGKDEGVEGGGVLVGQLYSEILLCRGCFLNQPELFGGGDYRFRSWSVSL